MENSSLGLRIGIPPEIAQQLRDQSSHLFHDAPAESSSPLASDNNKSSHAKEQVTDPLPGIRINLKKLVGYRPNDDEEVQSIQVQLIEAMWARYHQQQTTADEVLPIHQQQQEQQEDQTSPPPDFDVQVMELFDTGLAQYCDDPRHHPHNDDDDDDGHIFLPYPKYLQAPVTGESIPTITLVQELRKVQTLDFVQKLWKYLAGCSRTLFWKRDMAVELSHLVREEQARLEYQEWTESKRQAKLDNLYSIRETLVHQVELAKAKVDVLEEEREDQVKVAMEPIQRKILQRQQQDSLNAFGMSELSFPDEFQWLGLRDEMPLDEEDEWGRPSNASVDDDDDDDYSRSVDNDGFGDKGSITDDESSADESGNEGEHVGQTVEGLAGVRSLGQTGKYPLIEASQTTDENIEVDPEYITYNGAECPEEENEAGLLLPFQRRKKRLEMAKRRKKEHRRMTERKAREELLKKLESDLRTKLTSKELILAQTMHKALAEKMTKIEDLLDSLQDEVWEAEEEVEALDGKKGISDQDADAEFSLLDQVMAMILGATPNVSEKEPKEHYLAMQVEHRRIVQAWKSHFGRLPPPAGFRSGSSPATHEDPALPEDRMTSKEQRQQLGLTENDDDDWEALDGLLDGGSGQSPTTQRSDIRLVPTKLHPLPKEQEKSSAPQLVGLRPGGRVVRPSS